MIVIESWDMGAKDTSERDIGAGGAKAAGIRALDTRAADDKAAGMREEAAKSAGAGAADTRAADEKATGMGVAGVRGSWPWYLAALAAMFLIKYRYSSVDVELLRWILAPTARWAGILTGDGFTWQAGSGYVSHGYQFVIASTCSGIQFMMIVIAALVFGYVHHMDTLRRGLWWTGGSIVFSYVFTIFVNGVRIACAIFIPRRLPAGLPEAWSGGWLTPERFHTVIGIVVYFTSLLFIYELAGAVLERVGIFAGKGEACGQSEKAGERKDFERPGESEKARGAGAAGRPGIAVPVFWYFFIVLGIPFLNRAYERNREDFTEYTALLVTVCLAVLGIYWLAGKMGRRRERETN